MFLRTVSYTSLAFACLVFYVSTCELQNEKGSFRNSGDQAVRSMSLFCTKEDSMSHWKCFYFQNEHPPLSLISVYPHPKKIVNHQNQTVQGFKKAYFSKIRVAMFQLYGRKIRKRNTGEKNKQTWISKVTRRRSVCNKSWSWKSKRNNEKVWGYRNKSINQENVHKSRK